MKTDLQQLHRLSLKWLYILLLLTVAHAISFASHSHNLPKTSPKKVVSKPAQQALSLDFKMYPNPSKGGPINLEIEGIKGGKVEIILYNTIGKILYKKTISELTDNATLNIEPVDRLSPGLYFVSISSSEEVIAKKLVVSQ